MAERNRCQGRGRTDDVTSRPDKRPQARGRSRIQTTYVMDVRARVAIVIVLLAVASVSHADGRAPSPEIEIEIERAPRGAIASLPPGLWFRSGHYEDFALEHEPQRAPRFAAVAGVFSSAPAAESAARQIDRARVGLGFPWVVANHDLRIAHRCADAIVVVAGLFAARSDAERWRSEDRGRASTHVVALEPEAEAEDAAAGCPWQDDGGRVADASGRSIDVVHIEPTRSAPGYSIADLERTDRAPTTEARLAERAALAPVCTIARGAVSAFTDARSMFRFGWRYAPARCAGRVVYVPVEHTMRATIVELREDGARLHQITDVMCDSPGIDEWRYSLQGREEIAGNPPLFRAPCAS